MSNAFENGYARLNPEQKEAVDTIHGPVMVIAGPGSGKTDLLSLRVANILKKDPDMAPGNILCLTFTDAAAFNMRDRLVGFLGRDAYHVAIHTFHSFGTEIINRHPEYFYGGADFLPADDVTQAEILEDVFNDLEHGNPLRSEYNGKFVYLDAVKKAIEYLKKAGLTPNEFDAIIEENKEALKTIDPLVGSVFGERISKKLVEPALKLVEQLKAMGGKLPGGFEPFGQAMSNALSEALDAVAEHGTAPLTEWKKQWTIRGDDGIVHVTDFVDLEKIEAIAAIYRAYLEQMHRAVYFDFNDMILDTISVLEKNPGLRMSLGEQYRYILVDEFQDTNHAQMRLLHLLTSPEDSKEKPNIMVVGDDDQAIFKFQGAEISNILDFRKTYPGTKLVVLTANYRSTQEILDIARRVIRKGAVRLENLIPNLKKNLVAARKDIVPGDIYGKEFHSYDMEYRWIAKEAARLMREGVPAKEIAVISRKHDNLESVVPFFHAAQVPVAYEREENVLRIPQVHQLITMARFVDSLMRKWEDADDLLPEILSYPFWGLTRTDVWEISVAAHGSRPWLAVMRESGGKFAAIAEFFIDLGAKAAYATAEEVLHELIGGPQIILPDESNDEAVTPRHDMFSPFRSFYFGKEKFDRERADYLRFLSALRSFFSALREYHQGRPVSVKDMVEFVDLHLGNRMAINNANPFSNAENAVQFMSAHKAKGLQFEAVFVVDCEEGVWAKSRHGGVPLPSNLPIGPAGDTLDDQLRLFYVVVTRAKRLLYFTSCSTDRRGKKNEALGFLAPVDGDEALFETKLVDPREIAETPEALLVDSLRAAYAGPFVPDEKALLLPLLERYQLSVTHFQNFLNVDDAGPTVFFERNLLMFPEPKSPNGAFGSAIHRTIENIYGHLKSVGVMPTEDDILAWFKRSLVRERLNGGDFKRQLARGEKILPEFYAAKKSNFLADDVIERNFRDQGVVVGGVPLTGKIDRMRIHGGEMIVGDFKTGKAIAEWEPRDPKEKIKAWKYRRQIVFYKLLIENSREFGGGAYVVNHGVLEFVEPFRGKLIDLPLKIDDAEVRHLVALAAAVYQKIKNLDFPDISAYPKSLDGILRFEEDLLNGAI
jgi:DNA helicase-2/ATP-dependent DNA helicase PcrA